MLHHTTSSEIYALVWKSIDYLITTSQVSISYKRPPQEIYLFDTETRHTVTRMRCRVGTVRRYSDRSTFPRNRPVEVVSSAVGGRAVTAHCAVHHATSVTWRAESRAHAQSWVGLVCKAHADERISLYKLSLAGTEGFWRKPCLYPRFGERRKEDVE